MTIPSDTNRVAYVGAGSTATFPATDIKIFDEADAYVIVVEDSTGDETVLTLNTDYEVDDVGIADGFTVTLLDDGQDWIDGSGFLDTGWTLVIRRIIDLTQETSITGEGPFRPELHEKQYDRCVMIDQQQQDEIDRSLKIPDGEDPADYDLTIPTVDQRAGKVQGYDDDGNSTVLDVTTVGAPTDASYVVTSAQGDLGADRVLTGTANQITVTDNGANSTVVVSIPSNPVLPGNASATGSFAAGTTVTAGTGITATTGNITATTGDVIVTAGKVKVGTTPATTGTVRLSNNDSIYARNAGDSADVNLASIGGGQIAVGDSSVTAINILATGPLAGSSGVQLGFTPNTPAQLTGNVNDYVMSGTINLMTSDASRNITGIVPTFGGQMLVISNIGAQNIVLKNQDASSTAGNRIITGTGADLTIAPDQTVMLMYFFMGVNRWKVLKNA